MKKSFYLLFFFSLIVFSAAIFRARSIIWGDSLYYYSYTKSIVINHDINFENEAYRDDFGFPNEPEISEVTGKVINKFSPGSSILWMPAFVVGHWISKGFQFVIETVDIEISVGLVDHNFLSKIFTTDGYGWLTQYVVAVSAIFFSVVGLFFVYKFILLFFEKNVAVLTTISLYFTTQMFYYTSIDPLNSHSASFMLSALFLYLLAIFSGVGGSSHESLGKIFSWQKMLILGFLGGLITLVRNQDIVILLPATIYFLSKTNEVKANDTGSDNEESLNNNWMEKLNRLVLFWGSVFLVMSIQLFATLDLYGQLGSPYILGGEKLSWFRPDFIRVLFTFENGLFVFAPILFLAFAGLLQYLFSNFNFFNFNSISQRKSFAIISLSAFLLQLYVVGSWGREIIGGPYGSRMFISVLPHLMFGLALIFEKYYPKDGSYKNKKFFWVVGVGLVLLFLNNIVQIAVMLARF